jgi:hypothetical protein
MHQQEGSRESQKFPTRVYLVLDVPWRWRLFLGKCAVRVHNFFKNNC